MKCQKCKKPIDLEAWDNSETVCRDCKEDTKKCNN